MANEQQAGRLIGESSAFLEMLEFVSQIAPLNKPVLLVGERGTGKELIAARLHYLSQRWDQEFLKMNCAAINDNLLESELFGHEAGSFTGAARLHKGRFERADKGTLFLDELATTSPLVQEKLLRIIEYGEFERVGGSRSMTTNVRLIAATNDDLPTLAHEGKFREDLLDRLAFDVITLPPLRQRQDDIMLLAEYFAMNMALDLGREYFPGFSDRAREDLCSYNWPGNVRELKNVVERSVYRCQELDQLIDQISIDPFDSPFRIKPKPIATENAASRDASPASAARQPAAAAEFPLDLRTSIQEYEISLIKSALATCQFNQTKTADILGVTYHQLRGYLKKYDLLEKTSS